MICEFFFIFRFQSQFEDLQSECKKTKEAYDTLKKESGNIKPGR